MKILTGLAIGAAFLAASVANAQYYAQASVSGMVLSEGPRGFMLEGPDGNYGIVVTPTTIVTDPWNSVIRTGPGNVLPGDYVTATGYPTSQWMMQASQVVVRNANPPVYRTWFAPPAVVPGAGSFVTPDLITPMQQSVPNFNTLPAPIDNTTNPFRMRSFTR
jgi:hypothetical protein